MRFIRPVESAGVERRSPLTWRVTGEQGTFVVEPPRGRGFFCLLARAGGSGAPHLAFDRDTGAGFTEAAVIIVRLFPFGFYHLAPATLGATRRLRVRVLGAGVRCTMFETRQPWLVGVLHYLFNLRYREVKALTGAAGARAGGSGLVGTVGLVRANARRIAGFFANVAAGHGVREQQHDRDVLGQVAVAQAIMAQPVRAAMDERWAARGGERPLLSFVSPVYETPPAFLDDLLGSWTADRAAYAELVLVDDGSRKPGTLAALQRAATIEGVRVVAMARNGGIAAATNAGIAAARGEWLSFIDHDDAFLAGAIPAIARAIADHPGAAFFYTDELISDADLGVIGSFCKPAFDRVLLSGANYLNHFSVFRRERVLELGGLRLDREGSQDYDLVLRYLAGVAPGGAVHVPYFAYLWRRGEDSYSTVHRDRSVNNARAALAVAFGGADRPAGVEAALLPDLHRIRFPRAAQPLVSVVIPNRDSLDLVTRVVADLTERTRYPAIEIVVADNGSRDPAVLAFYRARTAAAAGPRLVADVVPEPFNFSAMCNRGARLAGGDLLLFLNNDVEVLEPDWLAEMVECLSFPQAGIVGARLLYPDGSLQHAGVIVGLGEAAGHWYVGDPADEPGPMGRLAVRQTLSAVTGACMLVTRPCFDAAGGFDEAVFPIAYNDIDLCLKAGAAGFRTVWTPFATLRHHESASRGSDETGENRARLDRDIIRLQERHGTKTLVDAAYSPFYDRRYSRPHLVTPARLPDARPNSFG